MAGEKGGGDADDQSFLFGILLGFLTLWACATGIYVLCVIGGGREEGESVQ